TWQALFAAMPRWAWLLALAASTVIVAVIASRYLWQPPSEYAFGAQRANYTRHAVTMMLHIGGGVVALLTGVLQFLPPVKTRRRLHRGIGTVYALAVLVGGAAGLHAATFAAGGASNHVAFTLFSLVWLTSTAMAMVSLLRRDIAAHQLWMKRSFAVTFGAVTFRMELGLLIFGLGFSFDEAYLVVPWTSWALNLLLVDWVPAFRRFKIPRPARLSRAGRV
ncbi:MAG: DUF2306 domain-containing protein, partial [Pseudomonadota bacterium]